MQDLIAQTIQAATDGKKQSIKHEMTVDIESKKLVENAIQAWGVELKNSRGAPSWSRVEPFIDDIDKIKSTLVIASDEDNKGAIQFEFAKEQRDIFTSLKELLTELATKVGIAPATISSAQAAFDSAIDNAQLAESFDAGMGKLAVSSFLEKTAELNVLVIHERFGELDAKSLASLSQIKAAPALEGDPNSDDAIAAQMPRHMALPDSARYQSMGQMVKAADAKALAGYIETAKEQGIWDESKVEACSKLGWVAANQGSVETMTVLLDKGAADIDFPANGGITPLAAACAKNHPAMIDFLLSRGADKKKTPVDGRSLMMLAASHDAVDAIKVLHKKGFDLEEVSLEGRTALHHAALGEDDKTATGAVKTLIELGANPTIVDDIGDEGGCMAEEYVDEESDDAYSQLTQYRKDWENGKTGPQTAVSTTISKARSMLGF